MVGFETSLLLVFITIGIVLGCLGWIHLRRTQKLILGNTVKILACCESLSTFYEYAVESQKVVELAVAAGIAHETLQENLQTSLSMN